MTVNRLPVSTWKWLKVNEAHVSVSGEDSCDALSGAEGEIIRQIPDGVEYSGGIRSDLEGIGTGMGQDMSALMNSDAAQKETYTVGENDEVSSPLKLTFPCKSGENRINRVGIHLGENSSLCVVVDYTMSERGSLGAGGESSNAALQTLIHLGKGASLCLIQIQRLDDKFGFLNDLGIVCDEGAKASLIQLVLGGGSSVQGCLTELSGRGSDLELDMGYLLGSESSLDLNYVARHVGKKSNSRMDFAGVLRGNARKLLRYTLDFIRGASASCGNEKEDVLLMDDGVVNQTVPLILCGEENVEGNHGATIGRVGEDLVFYMESRGMKREDIYEMMARGRIDSIIAKIPLDETREDLERYLDRI